MRRSLFRMISPSSLSAFSASIANGGIANGGISGVQPVRTPPSPARAAPPQSAPQVPPQIAPGQKLPRGSLLDLTA